MATQIVRTCDACNDEGTSTEGTQLFVALGSAPNAPVMSLDLCEGHRSRLITPLITVVEAHGYRADKAPAPTARASGEFDGRKGTTPTGERDLPCLWCDLTYAAPSGLLSHVQRIHGAGAQATITSLYGSECPLCGLAILSKRGTATHLTSAHADEVQGGNGVALRAFMVAMDAGDPHGVVARVRAAGLASFEPREQLQA